MNDDGTRNSGGRRKFLKAALLTSGAAAGYLASLKFNAADGIRIAGTRVKVGVSEAEASCSYGSNCGGGGGQCSYGSNCAGGGGVCSYGSNCAGGGGGGGGGSGQCSYGSSCGGGGGTCSYGSNCAGGGGVCSYGSNCAGR
jgi:hypothetical protein